MRVPPALRLLWLAPLVAAAPAAKIAIPAGRLGDAVVRLGEQTGTSIGFTDAALADLPTPAVRGSMAADAALKRLLKGLPVRAAAVAGGWRIVAAPRAPSPPRRPTAPAQPIASASAEDIVVTASKRGVSLASFPATVDTVAASQFSPLQALAGSDAIVSRLPSVDSTALGPGRNKLFIRGIADSGFNGPSESTVGEYLGDLRLNYNAPDPNLALIDMQAIEVIEGPQGMLYGAGSLGGIMQLLPVPPQLDRLSLKLAGGLHATQGGGAGSDVSGVLNLPLVRDAAALRLLAYRDIQGGYIDDVGRGARNVNRTRTEGGRAAISIEPGSGWSIRLDGVLQFIDTADGQYAEKGLPPLTRSSRIAQPFDNDYALAGLTITKTFGRISLRSATSYITQDVISRYDFTPANATPRVFDQSNRIHLLSNETRLSREDAQGAGWVIGMSLLSDQERVSRALGSLPSPPQILGVANSVTEIAGYAEGGLHLTRNLVASAGGRVDFAHLVGRPLSSPKTRVDEPRRNQIKFLPSLALNWTPGSATTIFLRYQKGFRPGGLSVSGNGSGIDVQRFVGDDISTVEAGGRIDRLAGGRLNLAATASYARWSNIQADLVDLNGLPFTANVGDGSIYGLEATATYRLPGVFHIGLSIAASHSRLSSAMSAFAAAQGRPLPNVPDVGASAFVGFQRPVGAGWQLSGSANMRYFGSSRLGLAPDLSIRQGNYVDTAAHLRLGTERLGLSLDATNLANAHGNRFALGDPYDVTAGRQYVPQRPRTIRIGFDAAF